MRLAVSLAALALAAGCAALAGESLVAYRVQEGAIGEALSPVPGDAARGRDVVLGRDGNCLLCHEVPGIGRRVMGNLGPSLAGVGMRLSAGELRLRIVDSARLNSSTIMPSYYRLEGFSRVAAPWRGKPVLSGQQVEDVVAFLLTLR